MKLVFLIGTGRCGSSLVHEVLAKHEDVGFVSNIEDNLPWLNHLGRWNNTLYRSPLGDRTRKGGLRFAPSEAYNLISRDVSPIYANSSRDLTTEDVTPWLARRFQEFFRQRWEAQGRALFTHKYTGWPRIGFFARIFPEAKFVHLIRDGRAVANSWLQMDWWGGYRGPENWLWGPLPEAYQREWEERERAYPALAAISWKMLMEAFHRAETDLGPERYLKLRFEDVLDDPRSCFEQLVGFCGLPWSTAFERQFQRRRFSTDRRRAFLDDLEPRQLALMNDSLGPLLERYGYE